MYLQDQIDLDPVSLLLSARYSDFDSFGSQVTWNAEAGWRINGRWRAGLTAGRAFRAPDATDRFGFGGNPDLNPETSEQVQARVTWAPAANHSVSLDLFRNDIDDLIEFDFSDFVLRNIARARVRGWQLGWRWQQGDWDLRVDALRQSAENAGDGSRLLRRADRSLTLAATRNIGDHSVALNVRADGERVDFGGASLPGYVLASLSGRFRLRGGWHLAARIENVLDTRYETASTFNTAGREGYLQLGYTWR
jgi:vitamin B12 transporter